MNDYILEDEDNQTLISTLANESQNIFDEADRERIEAQTGKKPAPPPPPEDCPKTSISNMDESMQQK